MIAADLSDQQARILRFIIERLLEEHRIPSVREIGVEVGMTSKNSVFEQVEKLERKGYLEKLPLASRGLKVLRWPDGARFGLVGTRNANASTVSLSLRMDAGDARAT